MAQWPIQPHGKLGMHSSKYVQGHLIFPLSFHWGAHKITDNSNIFWSLFGHLAFTLLQNAKIDISLNHRYHWSLCNIWTRIWICLVIILPVDVVVIYTGFLLNYLSPKTKVYQIFTFLAFDWSIVIEMMKSLVDNVISLTLGVGGGQYYSVKLSPLLYHVNT